MQACRWLGRRAKCVRWRSCSPWAAWWLPIGCHGRTASAGGTVGPLARTGSRWRLSTRYSAHERRLFRWPHCVRPRSRHLPVLDGDALRRLDHIHEPRSSPGISPAGRWRAEWRPLAQAGASNPTITTSAPSHSRRSMASPIPSSQQPAAIRFASGPGRRVGRPERRPQVRPPILEQEEELLSLRLGELASSMSSITSQRTAAS